MTKSSSSSPSVASVASVASPPPVELPPSVELPTTSISVVLTPLCAPPRPGPPGLPKPACRAVRRSTQV
eukprot:352084-Chlamydomonas_euryale.AAC.5